MFVRDELMPEYGIQFVGPVVAKVEPVVDKKQPVVSKMDHVEPVIEEEKEEAVQPVVDKSVVDEIERLCVFGDEDMLPPWRRSG